MAETSQKPNGPQGTLPPDQSGGSPIRLDFRSVETVVVTAEKKDRFVTTSRDAALACRSALDEEAWRTEFNNFLIHIHHWATANAAIVARVYVGSSSEGLNVVVITKGEDYRFELEDALTDLDIALARQYTTCRADVLQSPEGELETGIPYITPERSVQVYGDAIRPPGES